MQEAWYFNGLLDLSGNVLGAITGANAKQGKTIEFIWYSILSIHKNRD
ncbi:MAG: hypothetical protein WKG06_39100 [Segetibacter sp.]